MSKRTSTVRLAVALLAAACLIPAANESHAGQARQAATELAIPNLYVTQRHVSGTIKERPLNEVLEGLGGGRDFPLELPPDLRDMPVSARLHDLPVAEALQRILEPFDYVMTTTVDGDPASLKVSGLRAAWAPAPEPAGGNEEPIALPGDPGVDPLAFDDPEAEMSKIVPMNGSRAEPPGDPGQDPLEFADPEAEAADFAPMDEPRSGPGGEPPMDPEVDPEASEEERLALLAERNRRESIAPLPTEIVVLYGDNGEIYRVSEEVDPAVQSVRSFDQNFNPEPPPSAEDVRD